MTTETAKDVPTPGRIYVRFANHFGQPRLLLRQRWDPQTWWTLDWGDYRQAGFEVDDEVVIIKRSLYEEALQELTEEIAQLKEWYVEQTRQAVHARRRLDGAVAEAIAAERRACAEALVGEAPDLAQRLRDRPAV